MTGIGAPWEWFWKVWEHLGLLPNQYRNPKLTLRDPWVLMRIHSMDCRSYLRFSWCTPSNKNTLQVRCIDYCSLSTSKSYYSTQHLIQHSDFCIATLRRTTEHREWLKNTSRANWNNNLTKQSEWYQSNIGTMSSTKSPILSGPINADTYNSSIGHRSLRRSWYFQISRAWRVVEIEFQCCFASFVISQWLELRH